MKRQLKRQTRFAGREAFTLIEVLVVIGIIAILVAILLPALNEARRDARAVQCAANLHHVSQASAIYSSRFNRFPASYLYAADARGNYKISHQMQMADDDPRKAHGYLHWSYFLYSDGRVDPKAFQCPEFSRGGMPRTNPGGDPNNWFPGQVNDQGSAFGGTGPEDKQAPFIAYAGNAGIIPRNKFQASASNTRKNVFVSPSAVRNASGTIMAAEFADKFEWVSIQHSESGRLCKAHRPISPLYDNRMGQYGPFGEGGATAMPGFEPPFTYGPRDAEYGGLYRVDQLASSISAFIDDTNNSTLNPVNVVARHHPGGGLKEFGGAATFIYVDGHAEKKNVLDTLVKKEWGDRYYSVDAENEVAMKRPVRAPGLAEN